MSKRGERGYREDLPGQRRALPRRPGISLADIFIGTHIGSVQAVLSRCPFPVIAMQPLVPREGLDEPPLGELCFYSRRKEGYGHVQQLGEHRLRSARDWTVPLTLDSLSVRRLCRWSQPPISKPQRPGPAGPIATFVPPICRFARPRGAECSVSSPSGGSKSGWSGIS